MKIPRGKSTRLFWSANGSPTPFNLAVTWPADLWLQESLEIAATMSGISTPCFRRRARRSAAADPQCHVPAGWALPFVSAIHPT